MTVASTAVALASAVFLSDTLITIAGTAFAADRASMVLSGAVDEAPISAIDGRSPGAIDVASVALRSFRVGVLSFGAIGCGRGVNSAGCVMSVGATSLRATMTRVPSLVRDHSLWANSL